jgi:RND family efflux transporter MFP subunit
MRTAHIRPLVVALGLLTAGCGIRPEGKPRLGEVDRLPQLETITPERQPNFTVQRDYPAIIDAMEKADLCAQVRGFVAELAPDIDIGRRITKGETLIALDVPDLLAEKENKKAVYKQALNLREQAAEAYQVAAKEIVEAEAQEKKYQADVEFRELEHQRKVRLVTEGTLQKQLAEESLLALNSSRAAQKAAQALIDTKKARLKAAEVETKVAESRVLVARTDLERVEATLGFAVIKAPFDGVITKRWVDRGATIKDPGMPLLTVMRDDQMRLILDVPERDVAYVRADAGASAAQRGNLVELRVPALKEVALKQDFRGTVTLKATSLDPVTRTMRVEVHLPNKEHYLRPQMTGTARMTLEERKNVLTVPSSALVRLGERMVVYRVKDLTGNPQRGVVERVVVDLGLDDGKLVEIQGGGLTTRDLIITKGNGVVRAGDTVIPVPAR